MTVESPSGEDGMVIASPRSEEHCIRGGDFARPEKRSIGHF
jgi:hypothetical protein